MGVPEDRRPLERVVRRASRARSQRITVAPERRVTRRERAPYLGLTIAFGAIILVGAALLMLPWATHDGTSTDFLTAFFTATSATFVTGLIIVDTGPYWSGFGEVVILALIQIGGLGYMTGIVFIVLVMGRRASLSQRQVLRLTFGGGLLGRVDIEARSIILISIAIQLMGVVALAAGFLISGRGPLDSLWQSIFHSVSAFHNAGFDITGGEPSLFEYRSFLWIVGPITILSLAGALGMTTILVVAATRRWQPLPLNAKLILVGTLALIVMGFVGVLISEWSNPATIGGQPVWKRGLDSLLLVAGNRTSGFSTFDVGKTRDYTLFLLIGLMFIGGAAGSMTGGIKINVFMVLLSTVWSSIRGRARTIVFRREIPDTHVRRALAVLAVSFMWINIMALILSVVEGFQFREILFDQVSAFGLVGLSTGIIPEMSPFGKSMMIISMAVGRFAPFFIALELAQRETRQPYRYAREEVRIG